MTRLPTPGGDDGQWGQILNDFLGKVHTSDGSLKTGVVERSQLSSAVQTSLDAADNAIPSSQKGSASGVATLGSSGKLTGSQLPTNVAIKSSDSNDAGKAIDAHTGAPLVVVRESSTSAPVAGEIAIKAADGTYEGVEPSTLAVAESSYLGEYSTLTPGASVDARQLVTNGGFLYARIATGTIGGGFDSAEWIQIGAPKMVVSDTYPAGLVAGDFWLRPVDGGAPVDALPVGTFMEDAFDRADTAVGTVTPGPRDEAWLPTGTSSFWSILTNKLRCTVGSGVGDGLAVGIPGLPSAGHAIQVTIENYIAETNIWAGFSLLWGGTANYIETRIGHGSGVTQATVAGNVGGALATQSTTISTPGASFVLKSRLIVNAGDGTGIVRIYVNGTQVNADYALTAPQVTSLQSASAVRLSQRGSANSASLRYDNFSVTAS